MESVDLLQLWIESAFATLVMENYPFAVDPFPAWPMKVRTHTTVALYIIHHAAQLVNARTVFSIFSLLPSSRLTLCSSLFSLSLTAAIQVTGFTVSALLSTQFLFQLR